MFFVDRCVVAFQFGRCAHWPRVSTECVKNRTAWPAVSVYPATPAPTANMVHFSCCMLPSLNVIVRTPELQTATILQLFFSLQIK